MERQKDACRNENVRVEMRDDEIVLFILGDFTSATTPKVHECCKTLKKDERIKRILIDLKDAKRVDTSAFACIISYIKEHLASGTVIAVTHLSRPAQELLQLLKIENIIQVV